MNRKLFAVALFLLFSAAFSWAMETLTYSTAQWVGDTIEGDKAVVVACPKNSFVAFSGANTYTGGTHIVSGGIIISNVTALGTGPILCESGTAVRVCVSFVDAGTSLNAAVLDKLTVNAAEGTEPWVSIQLNGAGLQNNVDFSKQPYLWLGAPAENNRYSPKYMVGLFEPYSNAYHFGYSQTTSGEMQGLAVTNLVDMPDGTPRNVVCRGTSLTALSPANGKYTYTGSVILEDGAFCSLNNNLAFGSLPADTIVTNKVILRNGGRLNLKTSNATYDRRVGITVEGSGVIHSSGANSAVVNYMNGPLCGWGSLVLTDQGGMAFCAATNTFSGTIYINNWQTTYLLDIIVGNGENFSWNGATIQGRVKSHRLVLNSNSDATFNGAILGTGRIVKRGTGCVTLAKEINLSLDAGLPVITVENGTLRRGVVENTKAMSGLISLSSGAVFDLNNLPAASVFLPYGMGKIINPYGGTMTLSGAPATGNVFSGGLAGNAVVKNSGNVPWTVHSPAAFDGTLEIALGDVLFGDEMVCSNTVQVGQNSKLAFGKDISHTNGLICKFWLSRTWATSGNDTKLREVMALDGTVEPSLTADFTAFSNVFTSGEANNGQAGQPLANTIGSSRDNFGALFEGYFIAEQDGTYAFRLNADDGACLVMDNTNQVVFIATGGYSANGDGSVYLTKGHHPMKVYFLEVGGWEILQVRMKAPGETDYSLVPTRLLLNSNGGARLGKVTGMGYIGLAEKGVWPDTMDLSEFNGFVLADAYTASPEIGKITLPQASLLFRDFWSTYLNASVTNVNGKSSYRLTQGMSYTQGALNSISRIPLDRAWTLSFDFTAVPNYSSSLGDGFCLVLHDKGSTGYSGDFINGAWERRIGASDAYGMQFYMMPVLSEFSWVKDSVVYRSVAGVMTNTTFTMNSCRDNPMRVTMAYDGTEKLSITLQRGSQLWSSTNALAATDFAAKFPNGAYLGIWGVNGGFYTGMQLSDLVFSNGVETVGEFNGTLALANGTVAVSTDGNASGTLSAALDVEGGSRLTVASAMQLQVASTNWLFNLNNSAAKLTLEGNAAFSGNPIVVDFTGNIPAVSRVLADFTKVTNVGTNWPPNFVLGNGYPKSAKLHFKDNLLKIWLDQGTVVILR